MHVNTITYLNWLVKGKAFIFCDIFKGYVINTHDYFYPIHLIISVDFRGACFLVNRIKIKLLISIDVCYYISVILLGLYCYIKKLLIDCLIAIYEAGYTNIFNIVVLIF